MDIIYNERKVMKKAKHQIHNTLIAKKKLAYTFLYFGKEKLLNI